MSLVRRARVIRTAGRRLVTSVVASALLVGMVGVTGARAEEADPYVPSAEVGASGWGYVDLRTPKKGYPNPAGDAPVGAGDGLHRTRSYFGFDVAGFGGGKRIISAKLVGRETSANDCSKRAVEVWTTSSFTAASSWLRPPRELRKIASVTGAECVQDVAFDVTEAVARAAAKGDDKITLELRVPSRVEFDKRYGRTFGSDLKLQVVYNTPPKPATFVWTDDYRTACATEAPGTYLRIPYSDLGARIPEDPDGWRDQLDARLTVWPVDDPATRHVRQSNFYAGTATFSLYYSGIPVEDGKTYAYTFEVDDGTDSSAPSPTCYFTMDTVGPDRLPTITSEQYPDASTPSGDVGTPGTFTFDANGVDDVVGFWWGRYSATESYVAADRPGGTASITWTPTDSGNQHIYAMSVDKAGSTSEWVTHSFDVRESRPWISSSVYPSYAPGGGIGVPGTFTISPRLTGAVEHLYRFDDGEERVVAGGEAEIPFTPTRGGDHVLTVRSRDSSGAVGAPREYRFSVATAPSVAFVDARIVGEEAGVRLTPGMPGVTEYEYWWDEPDAEHKTVAADADGTASFRWVPSRELLYAVLQVRSRTASGELSGIGQASTYFDAASPTITHVSGGVRPGDPAVFTVSTRMPDPTEYEWQVDDQNSGVVTAGPDGTGVITWTPRDDGYYSIWISARNATGARSAGESKSFTTYSVPRVNSPEYPEWTWAGGIGVPGQFTFTPYSTTPDVVEYVYTYDDGWGGGPQQVVAAGPGGSATVTITPTRAFYNYVRVRARSADGTLSGLRTYTIMVND